ncbi:MAG: hypothetical protein ACRDD1_15225 [Planctomycetia bacterium]
MGRPDPAAANSLDDSSVVSERRTWRRSTAALQRASVVNGSRSARPTRTIHRENMRTAVRRWLRVVAPASAVWRSRRHSATAAKSLSKRGRIGAPSRFQFTTVVTETPNALATASYVRAVPSTR